MAHGSGDHSDSNASTDQSPQISRRKWLLLSSAGLTGLAGCDSSDGGSGTDTDSPTDDESDVTTTETTTTQNSGTPRDPELTRFQQQIPTDINWNFFIPGYTAGLARKLYHEIRPNEMHTLENWEYDAKTNIETWTFPENLTWWNGNQVTAEDEYVKWEIDRLQSPENSDLDAVSLVDDYTLEFHYKDQQNPTIVERSNALGTPIAVPRWEFQSWLEQYEDATTQSERDSVTEKLQAHNVSTQTVVEKGLGNHPYEMTEANSQEMVFELREDHPWATEDQVKTMRMRTITEDSSLIIQQDEIDMRGGFLPQDFQGPDHLQQILTWPTLQMSKVMFNHTNEHLQKRPVRRALAHLIDNEFIIQNQSPNANPVQKQTGMGDAWTKEWFGEEFYDRLHAYPVKGDPDGATELLNEAGYSKQGGSWVDPNGKTVSFNVLGMNWGAFVDGARTVNAQLDQFGFDVEFQALEYGSFAERAWKGMEHDLTFYYQNNWINHPVSYFRPHYPGGLRLAQPEKFRTDIEGWLEEGRDRSPFSGIPLTPTIPSEVGALELSGSGEQINLYDAWDSIHAAQSQDETVTHLEDLVRYWNYDVPHLVSLQMRGSFWGDTRDFDFPADDQSLKMYASGDVAMRHGQIKYKYE